MKGVFKSMQNYKSFGPYGWTVKFYQHFFELLVDYLVGVVEEFKIRGFVHKPLNTTFLALIPKSDDPHSFDDFILQLHLQNYSQNNCKSA